ncbi:MAG: hypothetical protein A3K09_02370 [Nitrospinae bacterium RIFCSPLOWO2_12_FULL_47_7]|nr:MAG: hypothetical protein A3K09_02370 [Nitrospinae bacterium RIFCSPLOWO2_12_FULL_47_7]
MGLLLKTDFKTKIAPKLHHFDPKNIKANYQNEIFTELFTGFPQFKAQVAIYVERNYCITINDEEHANPKTLLNILKPEEVLMLNKWILRKKNRPLLTQE